MIAKRKKLPKGILAIVLALLICLNQSTWVLAAYGAGFANEPPDGNGTNITDYFNIISGSTDPMYQNVTIITEDATNKYGAMWAKEKLDLTLPFETEMYLHLGHAEGKHGSVADGITFTLHNDPKGLEAIGGLGEGLGVYKGRRWIGGINTVEDGTYLKNSLVIEFDTYRNLISAGAFVDDPTSSSHSAHCALLTPGYDEIYVSDHKNVFFFNPVQDWVKFEAQWHPNASGGGVLSYSFDGVSREYAIANVTSLFGGTKVYWGFTGTTGDLTSLQAAAITKLPIQEVSAEKAVENVNGENVDGGVIWETNILKYTIKVTAEKAILGIGPIVVTDELSAHTEYAGGNVSVVTSDGKNFEIAPDINGSKLSISTGHILPDVGDWLTVSFDVKVSDGSKGNIVYNTAVVEATKLTEPQNSNTTEVTVIEAPNEPEKVVIDTTGVGGAEVAVGDEITYEISYENYAATAAEITIVDKLPAGVDFVSASNDGDYDKGTHSVTWTLSNVASGTRGKVKVVVKVNADAIVKIENTATVKVGGNNPLTTNVVENPVTPPEKKTITYDANGGTGSYVDEDIEVRTNYSVLTLRETGISRGGYVFKGWNTSPDGKGTAYKPGDTIIITEDVVLYAQWVWNGGGGGDKPVDRENHFAYIIGYPDGFVRPQSDITRAEVATIFFRLLTQNARADLWSKTNTFIDVAPGEWFNNAISTLANAGILAGYPDNSFAPNAKITRAEFAVIAVRFAEETSAEDAAHETVFNDISGHWAEDAIRKAAELGYVIGYGDGAFRPETLITRAEVATLVNRVLHRGVDAEDDLLEDMIRWPDNTPDKWFYLDVQEATNSHFYKIENNSEVWTSFRTAPAWNLLERVNSEPGDVTY